MELYARVRRAVVVDKMSEREAAKEFGLDAGRTCRDKKGLSCVEESFKADFYVLALLTPFEELLDPGIDDAIKILLLAGIPRFYGRNFIFCRSLI